MSSLTSNATDSASLPSTPDRGDSSRYEFSILFNAVKQLDPSIQEKVKIFQSGWGDILQRERMAILQQFATSELRDFPYDPFKLVMKIMLEAQPEQLEWPEGDFEDTPLHTALQNGNHVFSKVFLDVCKPATMINIIQKPTKMSPTLLHQAIWNKSPFTAEIIDFCSAQPSIFSVKDNSGRTPLHLAVVSLDEEGSPVRTTYTQGSAPHPQIEESPASHSSLLLMLPLFSSYDTVRHLIVSCPRVLLLADETNHTPYQRRLRWLQDYPEDPKSSGRVISHNDEQQTRNASESLHDDSVISHIREYSIRNFTTKDALRALYRPGQERDIVFDISRLHTTLSRRFLESIGQQVPFESILKLVALPNLDFEAAESGNYDLLNPHSHKPTQLSPTRRAAFQVFSWFREINIRKIIEVIVDDLGESYHSDETIENALEGFEVEMWNWKRHDIPSRVVAHSTGVVKQLKLYFSGRKAVLDSWSGDKGFGDYNLFPESEAETLQLIACINNFKQTIQLQTNSRVQVFYIQDINSLNWESNLDTSDGQLKLANSWLSSMVNFTKFLKTAPNAQDIRPVKVAIINDGIDVSLARFEGKIAAGISYSSSDVSTNKIAPYYVPSGKGGTVMATLICDICPNARLYVARVDEYVSGQLQINPVSIENAILWAVNCKVDIISIGCSLGQESPRPVEAIYRAHRDGISIFYAAARHEWSRHAYECINIGALTNQGGNLASPDTERDFLLPVDGVHLVDDNDKRISYESGDPGAIAMASGLAGLLIFCSRLLEEYDDFWWHPARIRDAFKSMSVTSSSFPIITDFLPMHFQSMLALVDRKTSNSKQGIDFSTLIWTSDCREALQQTLRKLRKDIKI